MKNEKLYDALLGIDQKYIEHSDDFNDVKTEFKRAKIRKIRAISSVCSCLAVALLAVFIGKNSFFMNKLPDRNDLISTDSIITEPTSERSDNISVTTAINSDVNMTSAVTTAPNEDISTTKPEATEPSVDDEKNNESDNTPPDAPIVIDPTEVTEYPTEDLKVEPTTEDPDDYDGLEEALHFKGMKYCLAYVCADDFTLSEFIGSVGQIDSSNNYLSPDCEVYTVEEGQEYLAVKISVYEVLIFRQQ